MFIDSFSLGIALMLLMLMMLSPELADLLIETYSILSMECVYISCFISCAAHNILFQQLVVSSPINIIFFHKRNNNIELMNQLDKGLTNCMVSASCLLESHKPNHVVASLHNIQSYTLVFAH